MNTLIIFIKAIFTVVRNAFRENYDSIKTVFIVVSVITIMFTWLPLLLSTSESDDWNKQGSGFHSVCFALSAIFSIIFYVIYNIVRAIYDYLRPLILREMNRQKGIVEIDYTPRNEVSLSNTEMIHEIEMAQIKEHMRNNDKPNQQTNTPIIERSRLKEIE